MLAPSTFDTFILMKLMDYYLHDVGVKPKRTATGSREISEIGVTNFTEKHFQVGLVLSF